MFKDGESNQSQKMGPRRIRELLIEIYPLQFNIPSEAELQQVISQLVRKRKEGEALVLGGSRGIRSKILVQVLKELIIVYPQHIDLTWSKFLPYLKTHFNEK